MEQALKLQSFGFENEHVTATVMQTKSSEGFMQE